MIQLEFMDKHEKDIYELCEAMSKFLRRVKSFYLKEGKAMTLGVYTELVLEMQAVFMAVALTPFFDEKNHRDLPLAVAELSIQLAENQRRIVLEFMSRLLSGELNTMKRLAQELSRIESK